jgi:hypothetical protein
LSDPRRSGLYRIESAEGLEGLGRAAGLAVSRVRLEAANDKQSLLRAVAGALEFPDWFGMNWDALEDCLSDLSWRSAEAHLLLFEGHGRLPGDVVEVFLDILRSAAGKWASEDARFFAVFLDPEGLLPALPALQP